MGTEKSNVEDTRVADYSLPFLTDAVKSRINC